MSTKQPRQRCGYCKGIGHNRLTCPKKQPQQDLHLANGSDPEPAKPAIARDIAMRTIIDPNYAVWLVCEGETGHALANATRELASHDSGMVGDTMLQALAELDLRARKVPADQIASVKDAKRRHDEALASYVEARRAITEKLGYKG